MAADQHPHILAVPYPAQGHVKPLLSLCYKIALHGGIKVTFVNAESIHAKIIAALSDQEKEGLVRSGISLVSIPDGLLKYENDNGEDPLSDCVLFTETIRRVMPVELGNLIRSINDEPSAAVTCVIADATLGWILDAVVVERVAFVPFGPAALALFTCIPNLIQAGFMDSCTGVIPENEHIKVSEDIPPWNNRELMWTIPGDEKMQKVFFECCLTAKETAENIDWLLCNTFYELDPPACELIPKIMPIGPLQMNNSTKNSSASSSGNFWPEDTSCLSWLDKQLPATVLYVAFGSSGIFNQDQFNELALGLEQSGQPFLWVVRPDSNGNSSTTIASTENVLVYPEGFLERMNGKIVKWAPQERVLAHPAIACFLSHCGWNSTMEGLCCGVPFLCWPYFADQLHNQKYICGVWKVGLKVNPDEETGIRSRKEIVSKIEEVLSDSTIKMNALKLKEWAFGTVAKGGTSYDNFEKFINHIKHI